MKLLPENCLGPVWPELESDYFGEILVFFGKCASCYHSIGKDGSFVRQHERDGSPTPITFCNHYCQRNFIERQIRGVEVYPRTQSNNVDRFLTKFRAGFQDRRTTGPTPIEFLRSLKLLRE